MEDGGLIKAGQVSHVLLLVVLRWVHLLHVVLADQHPLAGLHYLHLHIVSLGLLHAGCHEALGLVGNPDQPLAAPFGLSGGVAEGIPVHHQELEVGIRPVHVGHDVSCCHYQVTDNKVSTLCWVRLDHHSVTRSYHNLKIFTTDYICTGGQRELLGGSTRHAPCERRTGCGARVSPA